MIILAYGCLLAALVAVCALHSRRIWLARWPATIVALGAAGLTSAGGAMLVYADPNIFSIVAVFLSCYVALQSARIVAWRQPADYLYRNTSLGLGWLMAAVLASALASMAVVRTDADIAVLAAMLAVLQLVVSAGALASTLYQLRTSKYVRPEQPLSDGKLPTVTVAVPVRDEGRQLEACLTSVLSSNYSKMEILAYDDDSHDRTPDIIRSFAHAGVRFLRLGLDGRHKESGGWLDKNKAYAELAADATGEYILFCGADIRLGVHSLRRLIDYAVRNDTAMVAVLPRNPTIAHVPLLQSMRYYWELTPPRWLFRRPPVLSSCWLIRRDVLDKAGGFAAVKQSMSPESHLAHYAASHGGYAFVRSDDDLAVTSEKPVTDQRTTAVYRRYPQLHRRVELVALLTVGQCVLLVGPLVLAAIVAVDNRIPTPVAVLALVAWLLHSLAFAWVQRAAFPRVGFLAAAVVMLVCILWDVIYLHASMLRYEFGEVSWKRRNVSRHVMR